MTDLATDLNTTSQSLLIQKGKTQELLAVIADLQSQLAKANNSIKHYRQIVLDMQRHQLSQSVSQTLLTVSSERPTSKPVSVCGDTSFVGAAQTKPRNIVNHNIAVDIGKVLRVKTFIDEIADMTSQKRLLQAFIKCTQEVVNCQKV